MTVKPLFFRGAPRDKIRCGAIARADVMQVAPGPLEHTVNQACHVGVTQPKAMLEIGMPAF